jgi:hypothetical protein
MPHARYCDITQSRRGGQAGAAGEPGADRVEEHLRELLRPRAVHAKTEDPVGDGVRRLGGERLHGRAGNRRGEEELASGHVEWAEVIGK